MTTPEIQWLRPIDIPRTPGKRLTVKLLEGDLLNTYVRNDHSMAGVTLAEIKGWIPNET